MKAGEPEKVQQWMGVFCREKCVKGLEQHQAVEVLSRASFSHLAVDRQTRHLSTGQVHPQIIRSRRTRPAC